MVRTRSLDEFSSGPSFQLHETEHSPTCRMTLLLRTAPVSASLELGQPACVSTGLTCRHCIDSQRTLSRYDHSAALIPTCIVPF